jgi:hypothetical protein
VPNGGDRPVCPRWCWRERVGLQAREHPFTGCTTGGGAWAAITASYGRHTRRVQLALVAGKNKGSFSSSSAGMHRTIRRDVVVVPRMVAAEGSSTKIGPITRCYQRLSSSSSWRCCLSLVVVCNYACSTKSNRKSCSRSGQNKNAERVLMNRGIPW